MPASFTGTPVSGNEVLLSYSGLTTETLNNLTIYRTNVSVTGFDDTSAESATKVTENAKIVNNAGTFTDYNAGTTNYYYFKDGSDWRTTGQVSTSSYSPEMRADYVPADLNTVSQNAVYVAAQNSKGGVSYRAVNVPSGKNIALIVISTTTAVTDEKLSKQLGQIVAGGLSNNNGITEVESFQILAKGLATTVDGYTPQLSGSTQIKYVASN